MLGKLHVAIIGLSLSAQAGAVSVPNTFSAGQPAKAAEVNANFTALENAIDAAGSTSFSERYFISPSTNGQLSTRNVIVLKENRGNSGEGCNEDVYRVRVYFENTENISVQTPSGTTQPTRVWLFGFVCANQGTATANYMQEFVYALPSSGNFAEALGVEVNEDLDGDGVFEEQNHYGYRQAFKFNPLASAQLVQSTELYLDSGGSGEIVTANSYSAIRSSLGSDLVVGAPLSETFSDVMVQEQPSFSSSGGGRIRMHAKDIGLVQEFNNTGNESPLYTDQTKADAIYYRIEGQGTAGSLSGTPFDSGSGGTAAGTWFQ